MRVEQLPSVGDAVATMEAQRQRLADADLVGASRSALASARDALPDGWIRRRRARRWPWVAGAILGAIILGLVLLTPACRRWKASRRASGRPDGFIGDASSAPATSPADDTSDLAHPTEPDALGTPPPLVGGTD
ncbi:MAG: hypothetical protein ACYC65_01550 [Candidatus Limnocylindrales bacterium]